MQLKPYMLRRYTAPAIVALLILSIVAAPPAFAHGIFKKTLEKKYEGLRVTCNMCHIAKESKEVRNEFGNLFYEELKELDLSARWNAVKGKERKDLENDIMAPAILESLEKVAEMENADGQKYSDLLPAGLVEGSKLKSADGDDDGDDEEDGEDGVVSLN